MADEFSKPLQRRPARRGFALPRILLNGTAVVLALGLFGVGMWAALVDDPLGGEPVAVVSTKPTTMTAEKAAGQAAPGGISAQTSSSAAETPPPAGMQTVNIIDGMSGKRQQVTIPTSAAEPAKPSAKPAAGQGPAQSAAAQGAAQLAAGLDPALSESSRHGPIPKIAPDGSRPSQVYAKGANATGAQGAPRVAIVIGKLGVNASSLTDAFAKLPGPVTFAFTPYGTDLDRWVTRARGEGHEVLLQVPMEPFDYPDNDPGPQTLLTSLSPEQNIDRLHWAMSRFGGYVGLANFMGARFSNNEQGLATILGEASKRGLMYFDDGASTRSVAGQVAGAKNIPFARADVLLDAVASSAEIEGALAKLEALARERGMAVGFATALPISIERISKWIKAAAARGIIVVPLSAAANHKSRSS